MQKIIKFRWPIVAIWIIASIILTFFMPNLNYIINERGNATIDKSYPSQQAQRMIDSMSDKKGDTGIFVFYDKDKLSQKDMENIKNVMKDIKDNKDGMGITGVTDVFGSPSAKSQLVSKDETTMIAPFTYERKGRDTQTIVNDIESRLGKSRVNHYITGGAFISNDFLKQTNRGVEKSAIITIIFILVVLILMFRSIITPIVSLLTVGISYLTSMGIVGQLIDKLGFPVTSLTQMFLILILFGIGTDYNILLYNRFKEELINHDSVDDAIVATFKTAGKTVVYSSLTVFIAFLSLNFVKFGVYRSAVAVAVGIVVLVALLTTLTPAIFKMLGSKLFWPSKEGTGHKSSRTWEAATSFSVRRPYVAIVSIALLIIPILIVGSYKLSFDNLKDMNGDSPSVMGFNTVAEHFSKGTTMPTTVVLQYKESIATNEGLAVVDNITNKIKKIDGVTAVQSPTQPLGDEISDYYTGKQIGMVVNGLKSADDGISKIGDGLSTIHDKLSTPDLSQVSQLVSGTSTIHGGMEQLTGGVKQIQNGMDKGASGAEQITGGITKIKGSITVIKTNLDKTSAGLNQLRDGFKIYGSNYRGVEQGLIGLCQLADGINGALQQLGASKPELKELQQNAAQLSSSLTKTYQGLKTLNDSYEQTLLNFDQINNGLVQMSGGLSQIITGLDKLEKSQKALTDGLKQAGSGQGKIAENMQKLSSGLSQVNNGQKKMTEGLSTLGSSFDKLKNGIGASNDGLKKISDGIGKSNDFLTQLSSNKAVNIPKEAFENADFQKALDAYMSKDRKTVKFTVVLKDDPYSDKAIETVAEINKQLPEMLNGTVLADATFATGGETSFTNDIHSVATSDMRMAQLMVLAGIFIVLVLIIKSFWIPVYIIGSLILTFYSSISITSLFAKAFLNTDEIAWNVPFFGFVMIVALGVDYSIFLMTRYREYGELGPKEGIIKASANVGGVVLSAALILGGTFATLAPSGIKTLVELAICVCLGVFLLSLILLPLVIPSLISIEDKLVMKYSRYNHSGQSNSQLFSRK